MTSDRCDRCQDRRAVAVYSCSPNLRLCLSCHIDGHGPGGAPGLSGACKPTRGPFVRLMPGRPYMVPAAELLRC